MKWFTMLALLFLFTLPPTGLIVDPRLQDRMTFAEQLLSECSPSTYNTLERHVAVVEYHDSIGESVGARASGFPLSEISIDLNTSAGNFVGGLSHEIRHIQQFRSPINQVLVFIPAYRDRLERDANDYSLQVQRACRVGNFASR